MDSYPRDPDFGAPPPSWEDPDDAWPVPPGRRPVPPPPDGRGPARRAPRRPPPPLPAGRTPPGPPGFPGAWPPQAQRPLAPDVGLPRLPRPAPSDSVAPRPAPGVAQPPPWATGAPMDPLAPRLSAGPPSNGGPAFGYPGGRRLSGRPLPPVPRQSRLLALLFRYRPSSHAQALTTGLLIGVLWWFAVSLTLMPLLHGRAPLWSVTAVGDRLPSLLAVVLLSSLAGLLFQEAAVRHLGGEQSSRTGAVPDPAPPRVRVVILGGASAGSPSPSGSNGCSRACRAWTSPSSAGATHCCSRRCSPRSRPGRSSRTTSACPCGRPARAPGSGWRRSTASTPTSNWSTCAPAAPPPPRRCPTTTWCSPSARCRTTSTCLAYAPTRCPSRPSPTPSPCATT